MIPLVDLKAQYHQIKDDINDAIARVLDNTQFINGPEINDFEKNFSSFSRSQYSVGVSNGTDALSIALKSLGVEPGDEVVTAVNTFIATAEAISSVGAKPVFADVDPSHFNMTGESFERVITPSTKVVIPVHLYGQIAPMNDIQEVALKHNISIIEDAAQAHGATFMNHPVGHWSDVACYSFYPSKNLGAYGDAGAITTNDEQLANVIRKIKDHGRDTKYLHDFIGTNSRMDTLQAAILNVKLKYLPKWTVERQRNAAKYKEALKNIEFISLPNTLQNAKHVYHLYVIQAEDRDGLTEFLGGKGIGVGIHYPVPLHLQPAYEYLGYETGDFPVAESQARKILSLPMYPELTSEQILDVRYSIEEFLALEK